jgi:hypothetical protein
VVPIPSFPLDPIWEDEGKGDIHKLFIGQNIPLTEVIKLEKRIFFYQLFSKRLDPKIRTG